MFGQKKNAVLWLRKFKKQIQTQTVSFPSRLSRRFPGQSCWRDVSFERHPVLERKLLTRSIVRTSSGPGTKAVGEIYRLNVIRPWNESCWRDLSFPLTLVIPTSLVYFTRDTYQPCVCRSGYLPALCISEFRDQSCQEEQRMFPLV